MLAHARVQELHGVTVRQAIVGGLIDLPHPAAADPADDAVRPPDQRTWLYTGHHWRPDCNGVERQVSTTCARRVESRSNTYVWAKTYVHVGRSSADYRGQRSRRSLSGRRPPGGLAALMKPVARDLSALILLVAGAFGCGSPGAGGAGGGPGGA